MKIAILPGKASSAHRPYSLLLRAASTAPIWAGYMVLMLAYAWLRGLADGLLPVRNGEQLERSVFFGFEATRFLQHHVYTKDLVWLDFGAFLMHASWFFIPLLVAIVVCIVDRRRLMELMAWMVVAAYLTDVAFFLVPTTPPWMHAGVVRILTERSFIQYTSLDNNPVAAFPSMHACMPLVIALFLWLRLPQAKWLSVTISVYAFLVGLAVVYLGEHWVVDVIAGYAFAGFVAFLFVNGRVQTAVRGLPFDPVGRLVKVNDWLMQFGKQVPEAVAPDVPAELPRAA